MHLEYCLETGFNDLLREDGEYLTENLSKDTGARHTGPFRRILPPDMVYPHGVINTSEYLFVSFHIIFLSYP